MMELYVWELLSTPLDPQSSMSMKEHMYNTNVHALLPYGHASWSVLIEHLRRLSIYDNRFLITIVGISWEHQVSTSIVRSSTLGDG